jgi:hypothetical protein
MLKQLLTRKDADTGDCACPDQFERLKEVLGAICQTKKHSDDQQQKTVVLLREEISKRVADVERTSNRKFDALLEKKSKKTDEPPKETPNL